MSMPKKTQKETPGWYYSYNGESFGPYTQDELIAKIQSPTVSPIAKDCYVWSKSLGSWKPLVDIEPFASAAQPSVPAAPVVPVRSQKPVSMSSTSAKKVSPDVGSLKARLLESSSLDEKRDEAGARLDSRAQTLTNTAALNDEVPTHQAMPAIDDLVTNARRDGVQDQPESADEEGEDSTRVRESSPLLSFQSLDAIPDLRKETAGGKQEVLSKPFPSLSTLKPISDGGAKPISSFKTSSNAVPGISSLFGGKSGAPSSSANPSVKPGSLLGGGLKQPAFGGKSVAGASLFGKPISSSVPSIASPLKSTLGSSNVTNAQQVQESKLGAISKPTGLAGLKAELGALKKESGSALPKADVAISSSKAESSLDDDMLLDSKEDLAEALKLPDAEALLPGDGAERADSISNWLPSETDFRLDSKVDGIALSDLPTGQGITSTASQQAVSGLNKSISSVLAKDDVLADIDLDEDADSSMGLPHIDLDLDQSILPVAAQKVSLSTSVAAEGALELGNIDLDDGDSMEQLPAIDKVDAANDQASAEAVVGDESVQEIDLDMGAIDLDDEASCLLPQGLVNDLVESNADAPEGLADSDSLCAESSQAESAVARRSTRFDELMKRQEELAKASEEIDKIDYQENANPDGPSEASMLIELSMLRDVEKADTKKRNMTKFAIIGVVALVFAVIVICVTIWAQQKPEDSDMSKLNAGFGTVQGRSVGSDTLVNDSDEIGEVEIIGGSGAEKVRHRGGSDSSARKAANQANAANTVDDAANSEESAVAAAPTVPVIRADGRKSADLGRAVEDNSALEAVAGSKYQGMNKASAADAPDRMVAGWKKVQPTIVACQKRLKKTGSLQVDKFYVTLKIKADGAVDSFTVTPTESTGELVKCLESKKDMWNFGPGEATVDQKVFIN